MRSLFAIPVAALAMSAATPALADPFKPGKADQVKLGQQAAAEIRRKERVLPSSDPRVQTLRRVGSRIVAAMSAKDLREPWQYSFDVIESKQLNAFALPGGPVFFYTGLMERMKTEDELAGVLAHEIIHIQREHWAYQYRDAQKANGLLTIGMLIFKPGRAVGNIAGLTTQLMFLKFSRNHETQADDQGFDLMARGGYNPEGMARVFEMLGQASRGGKPPEFLSSHPSDTNRVRRIRERAARSRQNYPALRPMRFNDRYDDGYSG